MGCSLIQLATDGDSGEREAKKCRGFTEDLEAQIIFLRKGIKTKSRSECLQLAGLDSQKRESQCQEADLRDNVTWAKIREIMQEAEVKTGWGEQRKNSKYTPVEVWREKTENVG